MGVAPPHIVTQLTAKEIQCDGELARGPHLEDEQHRVQDGELARGPRALPSVDVHGALLPERNPGVKTASLVHILQASRNALL